MRHLVKIKTLLLSGFVLASAQNFANASQNANNNAQLSDEAKLLIEKHVKKVIKEMLLGQPVDDPHKKAVFDAADNGNLLKTASSEQQNIYCAQKGSCATGHSTSVPKVRKAKPFQEEQQIVVYATARQDAISAVMADTLMTYRYQSGAWHREEPIAIPIEEGCLAGSVHSIAASQNAIRLGCYDAYSLYYSRPEHKFTKMSVQRHDKKHKSSNLHITAVAYDGSHFHLGYQGRYIKLPEQADDIENAEFSFDFPKENHHFQTETLGLLATGHFMFMTMSPAQQPFYGSTPMFHKATFSKKDEQAYHQSSTSFISIVGNLISKNAHYGFTDQIYLSLAYDNLSKNLCFMGASHDAEVVQKRLGRRYGVCVNNPLEEKPKGAPGTSGYSVHSFTQFKNPPEHFLSTTGHLNQ